MKWLSFSAFLPLFLALSGLATALRASAVSIATRVSGGAAVKTQRRASNLASPAAAPVAFIPLEDDTPSVLDNGSATKSLWSRIRSSLGIQQGISLKEQLTKQGLAAYLTYVMLANLCNLSFLSIAWYGFSLKTGMSPLFPGQWKPFLAVFAGFMATDVALKPIRLVASIGLAPRVSRAMSWLQNKLRGSKAITLAVVFAGITASSLGIFAGGITLASALTGVPIFAP